MGETASSDIFQLQLLNLFKEKPPEIHGNIKIQTHHH
jgi:hypothetical protein